MMPMTGPSDTPVTMQLNDQTGLEAGSPHLEADGPSSPENDFSDPFDIANTKKASFQALKRWREAALALNSSRRFRYTLDLRKAKEKEQRRRMIRAHAQVIRAAQLFKLSEQRAIVLGTEVAPLPPSGDFGISLEQLASVTRDHNLSALQQYGGAKGLSEKLKTDIDSGIVDDELSKRKNVFGANTYPMKKGCSYLRFLWEAWHDLTLIILIVAAVLSLALGIHTKGLKEGWYDGGSITFAVLLVIFVTGNSFASCLSTTFNPSE